MLTLEFNFDRHFFPFEAEIDYICDILIFRTLIELVLPSSVDRTIVPDEKSHVALIFTQYTPYELKNGKWDQEMKDTYAKNGIYEFKFFPKNFLQCSKKQHFVLFEYFFKFFEMKLLGGIFIQNLKKAKMSFFGTLCINFYIFCRFF
jgi:hypothetical protein